MAASPSPAGIILLCILQYFTCSSCSLTYFTAFMHYLFTLPSSVAYVLLRHMYPVTCVFVLLHVRPQISIVMLATFSLDSVAFKKEPSDIFGWAITPLTWRQLPTFLSECTVDQSQGPIPDPHCLPGELLFCFCSKWFLTIRIRRYGKISQPATVSLTTGDYWYICAGVCAVRAGDSPTPHTPFSANNHERASYKKAKQIAVPEILNKIIPDFFHSPFHSLISDLKIFPNTESTRNHAHSRYFLMLSTMVASLSLRGTWLQQAKLAKNSMCLNSLPFPRP